MERVGLANGLAGLPERVAVAVRQNGQQKMAIPLPRSRGAFRVRRGQGQARRGSALAPKAVEGMEGMKRRPETS